MQKFWSGWAKLLNIRPPGDILRWSMVVVQYVRTNIPTKQDQCCSLTKVGESHSFQGYIKNSSIKAAGNETMHHRIRRFPASRRNDNDNGEKPTITLGRDAVTGKSVAGTISSELYAKKIKPAAMETISRCFVLQCPPLPLPLACAFYHASNWFLMLRRGKWQGSSRLRRLLPRSLDLQ